MSEKNEKARYWAGVMYVENMEPDWEDSVGDTLQLPYSYVVHDKDTDSEGKLRKAHVDMIIAFNNSTTYNFALSVFKKFTAEGKPDCINKCERVYGIRNRYNYQIHNTEDCRKKKKHLYDESERHTGNSFDIGMYEQLTASEKNAMVRELTELIFKMGFTNFVDFTLYVMSNFSDDYFEILKSNNGFFERLTRGNYQKWQTEIQQNEVKAQYAGALAVPTDPRSGSGGSQGDGQALTE